MNIERFKTILLLAVLMLFMVPQRAWASYRAVATKGKLPGAFSVSATKQVWFSQGNLQYQADNGDGGSTWRFAINQYDFVGDATHGNVYEKDVKTGGLDPSYENNRRIGLSVRLVSETMFPGSGTADDPYLITSVDTWNYLADQVNNGTTYSGKYFRLTNDISVTTMVTATFSGTFDGGGHTLTFNYTATGDNAAPFAYITGATIKNLRVAGTINTGYKFAAGIVAISNGGTITNCRSSVTIASSTSGDGTHGGLVADSFQGKLDINNCLFDGKLLGTTTTSCGGIVGWHKQGTLNITNTLFAPAEVTVQGDGGAIFARNGATSLDNCYYISDWSAATVQGENAGSMTAEALVAALNNGTKNWCVHRGNAIPVMVNLVINNKTEWDNFSSHAGNYENKYVQLNADITNITAMTSGTFQGIFDGNGHTLTVNLTNSGGNVAPFQNLNGGTIMNLTVTGTVTGGANYCSGLVARTTGGVCQIDNCVVNTNNTGVGFVGGVVAHADNATSLTISNCIYGGTIAIQPNGNNENYSGGILGWYNNDKTLDLVMTNCLFKGDYTGNGQFHPIGVKKWAGIFKSTNCTNCYYTKNPANIDGPDRFFTDGTKVSELTIGTTGVSIASGSYATFQGTKYYYGTVTLGYNGPMATTNFSLDGTHLNDNSFTISTDNAAFDDGTATIKWDFPGRGTVEDPYQISSAAVWDFLADQVNGGTNYSGKYFQLTNDINVTTMVGTSTYDGHFLYFSGIFDGDGKTLNVELVGTTECTAAFSALDNATIKNLHITGSINTPNVRPASIAGFVNGNCTIENCWSEVAISSSHSASENNWIDAGAFVARVNGNQSLTLTGCLFTGSITYDDETAYEGGGMVGWTRQGATVTLNKCVFAPSAIGITMTYNDQYVFVTGLAQKNINDCYYNDVANSSNLIPEQADGSKLAYSITPGDNVTITNLGSSTATYDVSGITAYDHGIKYNDMYYAGASESVSLNLDYTSHSGYSFHSFTASAGTLTGESNPYTLTMAAANATINVRYSTSKSISAATSATNGWYLIASPMNEAINPVNVTNMTNVSYDIFRFNQSAEMEWQNWEQTGGHYHFNLEPGRGYLYANSSDVTLTFIGTPYSGTGEFALEYSTSNPDTRMRGWNLIGNPFGVTATIARDCYKMQPSHDEVILCESPATVSPMEGVFVHATAENQTVTFSTGAKRETAGAEDRIVINLSDNKGTIIDRAIVSFEKDHTLPKFQINESSTKLYIPQNGKDYAIAFAYRIGDMPLNFKAEETGRYTLSFSGKNMTGVSLVDKIDNSVIDLSVNDTYTFIGTSADRADRFKLVFSSPNDSNIEIFAYQTGNEIVVSGEGELQVFDLMGRMILTQRINGVQTIAKPLQTGVYIFRLNEKSQKIVVR